MKEIRRINFENGEAYEGEIDVKTGKPHGFGRHYVKEALLYVGGYKNGLRHGKGTLHLTDGRKYEGRFKNGSFHGKGAMYFNEEHNIRFFEGRYKNGIPVKGTKYYRDGRIISGKINKDGNYYGKVNKYSPDGAIITEHYCDGKTDFSSKITIFLSGGAQFKGYMHPNGDFKSGTMEFKRGESYNGEFHNNKFHGYGEYKYSDGIVYKGYWKNGERCGSGTVKFPDGDRYEGIWSEDGTSRGVYYSKNGESRTAYYDKNGIAH